MNNIPIPVRTEIKTLDIALDKTWGPHLKEKENEQIIDLNEFISSDHDHFSTQKYHSKTNFYT